MGKEITVELERSSVIAWITANGIVNEKGDPIDFYDHPFLYDIYIDPSPLLCVMKCAQCGMSTCSCLRNHHAARNERMDVIYTMPAASDAADFVSGKVNRIIAANPSMLEDVADKDSVKQKQVRQSIIHFLGTFSDKSAITHTADRVVHDEIDSSDLSVIPQFEARLQHSRFKHINVFSHPSVPRVGVHAYWIESDQKEWFVRCPDGGCGKEQFLSWSTTDHSRMSVDIGGRRFRCKFCDATLSEDDRRGGRWVARRPGARYSGYHISLLMCPWVGADEVVEKWHDVVVRHKQTEAWFYSKVLGLPFSGSGNTVNREAIMGNVRAGHENPSKGRLVVGVDTGLNLRWVAGNAGGISGYGEMEDFEPRDKRDDDPRPAVPLERTLEWFLVKWPDSVMLIDQGGEIKAPRSLQAKYPGRVFLCHYREDAKSQKMFRWGKKDENGTVVADRNRVMQMVIDEFGDGLIPLWGGTEPDWEDYWAHWSHIYRVEEQAKNGVRRVWKRTDRDDYCHATVYWRILRDRFGSSGSISGAQNTIRPNSYMIDPDGTATFDPADIVPGVSAPQGPEHDWRV